MTLDELYDEIQRTCSGVTRDGDVLRVSGDLDLGSVTTLPANFAPHVGGDLDLGSVTTLPANFAPHVGGHLWLDRVTTLPADFAPHVGGHLWLDRVTTLPENFAPHVGGDLYLSSVTTLPENFAPHVSGSLYLSRVTTLPDDSRITASMVCAPRIDQQWNGRHIKSVDVIVMELATPHAVGSATVYAAKYFGRTDSETVYVAQVGEHWAHGDTVRDAIDDATDKAQIADPSAVLAEIKATGRITRQQYRALTGACRRGIREWCASVGIGEDVESLPVSEVLERTRGQYGHERFAELVGQP